MTERVGWHAIQERLKGKGDINMNVLIRLVIGVAVVGLGATNSVAQGSRARSGYYVVSNNGNAPHTASVFKLDPSTGKLSLEKVLHTGGKGNSHSRFAGEQTIAISADGSCTFLADELSSDIAAYGSFDGKEIGRYKNAKLNAVSNPIWGDAFLTLAENGPGTVLYATYASSNNLAVWTINHDCSLSLANIYPLQDYSQNQYGGGLMSMTVSPDGTTLLGSYGADIVNDQFVGYVESWAISGTTLTDNGAVLITVWPKGVSRIFATNDNNVVVMDTISTGLEDKGSTAVVTANLPGFTNQKLWTLAHEGTSGLALSPDAAAGSGCMYVAATGVNGDGGRVYGARFTESPLKITKVNKSEETPEWPVSLQLITNKGNGGGVYAQNSYGNPTDAIDVHTADSHCKVKFASHTNIPVQGGGWDGIRSWAPPE